MKINNFIQRSLTGAFSFLKESLFSDEYAVSNGFLQARDARVKVLMVGFLLLAVLYSRNIWFLAGLYAFCILLAFVSSIHIRFFLKRTWVFIPLFSLFIAVPALFNIFSPGEPLVSFRLFSVTLSITKQGAASAAFFFTRVLASVSLCILLVLTTQHFVLLKVLRVFKIPQIFVTTLGMCYRYIYLFMEIIQNTYLAVKSRVGFVTSVKSGQKLVAWNIASLWQRSYLLHHEVYSAMLSRGYNGEPKVMDDFHSTFKDWFCLVIAVFIFGVSLWQNKFLH